MSSKVLALFHLRDVGYVARLEVTLGVYREPAITVHTKCARTIFYARNWVRDTLGLEFPDLPFTWTVDPPLKEIDGYSLFGAFASTLLQEYARLEGGRADCMRGGCHASLSRIRATSLNCIAISAAMDADDPNGCFATVGKIDEKLIRLASSRFSNPACVVAWQQERPTGWCFDQWDGGRWVQAKEKSPAQVYERWHVPNVKPLPIIHARDPLDAVLRVFDLQCNSAGSRLLPL